MPTVALPHIPDALQPLQDLALDLRWTWSHEADSVWEHVDGEVWERTQSPWAVLQHVSPDRLRMLAGEPGFVQEVRALEQRRREYLEQPGWFDAAHGKAGLGKIAYFSMEFGLGAALPLYAGGLGVLAGDFLKSASDLRMPVVGVGLLYQEGYFRQMIDAEGAQHEAYPYNEPAMMPIEPAMVDDAWLTVKISLPGRSLNLRVWQARVGRVMLYLLDSNHLLNIPADRGITGKLYGGDAEMRLMQEAVLGIGGWRALEALGHDIEICHINEGHAALVVIERARRLAARGKLGFWDALWAGRPGNVFTTHTPVAAGFDRFEPALLRRYLPAIEPALAAHRLSWREILGLGRADPDDDSEPFNMAYLAMRGSGATLGVSRLHGEVSRRIFQPLFPRWPEREVPVGYVTNGVHVPTWDSAEADELWTEACGKERWRMTSDELPSLITAVSDEEIWSMRGRARQKLVAHVRERLSVQLRERSLTDEAAQAAGTVLDPNVLTLGFARRFTAYKRPTLLLHDLDRLSRFLLHEDRPAQIVVAGKAHPADAAGKAMITEWLTAAGQARLRSRVVFLDDYDIAVAQQLVQGVDVWINNPRRPWEACGTSGMKVLVNGGLNCSIRDGWWDEAYSPDLGWAIGRQALTGDERTDAEIDEAEAERLYDLLESEIAPEFYDRDAQGVPRAWVARIRRSMSVLTPAFSGARMARDYIERAYLPAAASLRSRLKDDGALARDLAGWADQVRRCWPGLHIAAPTVLRAEEGWRFTVPVFLGELTPEDVTLELYAEGCGGDAPQIVPLTAGQPVPGAANGYVYSGSAPLTRAANDFTVRARRRRAELLPSELPLVAWQR